MIPKSIRVKKSGKVLLISASFLLLKAEAPLVEERIFSAEDCIHSMPEDPRQWFKNFQQPLESVDFNMNFAKGFASNNVLTDHNLDGLLKPQESARRLMTAEDFKKKEDLALENNKVMLKLDVTMRAFGLDYAYLNDLTNKKIQPPMSDMMLNRFITAKIREREQKGMTPEQIDEALKRESAFMFRLRDKYFSPKSFRNWVDALNSPEGLADRKEYPVLEQMALALNEFDASTVDCSQLAEKNGTHKQGTTTAPCIGLNVDKRAVLLPHIAMTLVSEFKDKYEPRKDIFSIGHLFDELNTSYAKNPNQAGVKEKLKTKLKDLLAIRNITDPENFTDKKVAERFSTLKVTALKADALMKSRHQLDEQSGQYVYVGDQNDPNLVPSQWTSSESDFKYAPHSSIHRTWIGPKQLYSEDEQQAAWQEHMSIAIKGFDKKSDACRYYMKMLNETPGMAPGKGSLVNNFVFSDSIYGPAYIHSQKFMDISTAQRRALELCVEDKVNAILEKDPPPEAPRNITFFMKNFEDVPSDCARSILPGSYSGQLNAIKETMLAEGKGLVSMVLTNVLESYTRSLGTEEFQIKGDGKKYFSANKKRNLELLKKYQQAYTIIEKVGEEAFTQELMPKIQEDFQKEKSDQAASAGDLVKKYSLAFGDESVGHRVDFSKMTPEQVNQLVSNPKDMEQLRTFLDPFSASRKEHGLTSEADADLSNLKVLNAFYKTRDDAQNQMRALGEFPHLPPVEIGGTVFLTQRMTPEEVTAKTQNYPQAWKDLGEEFDKANPDAKKSPDYATQKTKYIDTHTSKQLFSYKMNDPNVKTMSLTEYQKSFQDTLTQAHQEIEDVSNQIMKQHDNMKGFKYFWGRMLRGEENETDSLYRDAKAKLQVVINKYAHIFVDKLGAGRGMSLDPRFNDQLKAMGIDKDKFLQNNPAAGIGVSGTASLIQQRRQFDSFMDYDKKIREAADKNYEQNVSDLGWFIVVTAATMGASSVIGAVGAASASLLRAGVMGVRAMRMGVSVARFTELTAGLNAVRQGGLLAKWGNALVDTYKGGRMIAGVGGEMMVNPAARTAFATGIRESGVIADVIASPTAWARNMQMFGKMGLFGQALNSGIGGLTPIISKPIGTFMHQVKKAATGEAPIMDIPIKSYESLVKNIEETPVNLMNSVYSNYTDMSTALKGAVFNVGFGLIGHELMISKMHGAIGAETAENLSKRLLRFEQNRQAQARILGAQAPVLGPPLSQKQLGLFFNNLKALNMEANIQGGVISSVVTTPLDIWDGIEGMKQIKEGMDNAYQEWRRAKYSNNKALIEKTEKAYNDAKTAYSEYWWEFASQKITGDFALTHAMAQTSAMISHPNTVKQTSLLAKSEFTWALGKSKVQRVNGLGDGIFVLTPEDYTQMQRRMGDVKRASFTPTEQAQYVSPFTNIGKTANGNIVLKMSKPTGAQKQMIEWAGQHPIAARLREITPFSNTPKDSAALSTQDPLYNYRVLAETYDQGFFSKWDKAYRTKAGTPEGTYNPQFPASTTTPPAPQPAPSPSP